MMTESSNFSVLSSKHIIELLINGSFLKYLTGAEILSIGATFNINVEEGGNSRWMMMQQVLNGCHQMGKTSKLLSYLTSLAQLREQIEALKNGFIEIQGTQLVDNNKNFLPVRDIQSQIVDKWKQAINEQLEYADLKLVFNSRFFEIISIGDSQPEIVIPHQRINNDFLKKVLAQAEDDLKDGDYDSVVTKARTILEGTFMQIMDDQGISYKENGNMGEYRGLVVKELGMKIDSSWNPRVKKLVSGINKVVDSIIEMRNDDSDAHVSSDRIAINAAEAQLLISSAVSVATYYLMIEDRQ